MYFSVSSAAAILAFCGVATSTPTWGPKPVKGLHNAMVAKGRAFFGTALTLRDPPDTKEQAIILNHADFGSVTPENAMKWESVEPTRNNFTFADADAIAKYAAKNKKQIHCHNLVWHSQLPAWVSSGGFDNKTLISIMENHIKKLAGRYKGQCTRWDVVNEALNDDGSYRQSVFYNTIGEAFLPIAFRLAHAADPHAKLYYNDYNLEYNSNKTLAARNIVKLVKSYGVHIDGVGFQAHMTSESTPTSDAITPSQKVLEQALRQMTSLGVDVAYTELDVRFNTPITPAKLKVQAESYDRIVRSCLAVKRCAGITSWGVSDVHSWIPDVFKGEGGALMWDENYMKKPAYDATLKAIETGC